MHRLFAGAVFRLDPGLLYTRRVCCLHSRQEEGLVRPVGIDTE